MGKQRHTHTHTQSLHHAARQFVVHAVYKVLCPASVLILTTPYSALLAAVPLRSPLDSRRRKQYADDSSDTPTTDWYFKKKKRE